MGDDDSKDDDFICGSSSDESEDYEIKDELLPWYVHNKNMYPLHISLRYPKLNTEP